MITKPKRQKCIWLAEHPYHNLLKKMARFQNGQNTFTLREFLDKFGQNPKCYLTGKNIDFKISYTYSLDHVFPRYAGGSNTLDNCRPTTQHANMMKYVFSVDELINMCKQILTHFGYKIEKLEQSLS